MSVEKNREGDIYFGAMQHCLGGGVIKSWGCNSVGSPPPSPPLIKFAACISGMKGGGKTLVLTGDGEGECS